MANYLLMIYANEAAGASSSPADIEAIMQGHMEFGQKNADKIRFGTRLGGSATATSIRHNDDGTTTLTDGTFAETKEVLAGFYVVEAADLDEALALARQIPAPFGGIEVRPFAV